MHWSKYYNAITQFIAYGQVQKCKNHSTWSLNVAYLRYSSSADQFDWTSYKVYLSNFYTWKNVDKPSQHFGYGLEYPGLFLNFDWAASGWYPGLAQYFTDFPPVLRFYFSISIFHHHLQVPVPADTMKAWKFFHFAWFQK